MELSFTVASESRQLDGEDLFRALSRSGGPDTRLTRVYGSGTEGHMAGVLETILAIANSAAAITGAVAACGAWLSSRRMTARRQDRPLEITVETAGRRVVLKAGTPEEIAGAIAVLALLDRESPE
ncbi:hypothetical protein AB0I28_29970 [Phytomonospora sp. NPDC050363]|uniref:effector-associated constant component EACC1 n=1 Tax=Phytomonospora sp. NPDC050363 TaxID=3155642 RepID=UPI0033DE292A